MPDIIDLQDPTTHAEVNPKPTHRKDHNMKNRAANTYHPEAIRFMAQLEVNLREHARTVRNARAANTYHPEAIRFMAQLEVNLREHARTVRNARNTRR